MGKNKDTQIIKIICGIIITISLWLVIGIIGGCEVGDISLSNFIFSEFILACVIILATIGYYKMQSIEDGRNKYYKGE